jgi:hypothetical protein
MKCAVFEIGEVCGGLIDNRCAIVFGKCQRRWEVRLSGTTGEVKHFGNTEAERRVVGYEVRLLRS